MLTTRKYYKRKLKMIQRNGNISNIQRIWNYSKKWKWLKEMIQRNGNISNIKCSLILRILLKGLLSKAIHRFKTIVNQITHDIFHRTRTNTPEIYMQP